MFNGDQAGRIIHGFKTWTRGTGTDKLSPWLLTRFGGWNTVLVVFGPLYVGGAEFWLLLKPEGAILDQALVHLRPRRHSPKESLETGFQLYAKA